MKDTKFNLEGKTAVITGASRGIGLAIANAFLESNASVVNISKSNSYIKLKQKYTFVQEDISNIGAIENWVKNFGKDRGKIDFWINNAGIYSQSFLIDVSEQDWDKTFSINLKSLFFASKFAAQHMKERGGGIILNASSFAAKMPSLNRGVYSASKAAVMNITKSMAAEWAPYGIRVNSYSPGLILTDMTRDLISKKEKELVAPIALSRYGSPEEVANTVLFLCSDAASYITGQDVEISGGKFIVQNQRDAYKK